MLAAQPSASTELVQWLGFHRTPSQSPTGKINGASWYVARLELGPQQKHIFFAWLAENKGNPKKGKKEKEELILGKVDGMKAHLDLWNTAMFQPSSPIKKTPMRMKFNLRLIGRGVSKLDLQEGAFWSYQEFCKGMVAKSSGSRTQSTIDCQVQYGWQ